MGDCPVVCVEPGECAGAEVVSRGDVTDGPVGPAWHCENAGELLGSIC